ncbi:MAG: PEP-CTERM-box response regulator transcription factor [Deltaproteobacteria bacterium]|jgi:two-component system NtrC family response regulator|nr:PEP-CTERM-box response regulator transcription factor [Deltaproteobacteria bacterium]
MKKNLLVIEDENSVAKQLQWGLGKEYEITIVSDAGQARPLLASGVFPVATLDLGLPPYPDTPQEGFELLEEISSLAPHTRVIVITGNAEEENAVKAIALGAADFCAKPIDLKILKIILSRTFKIHELEETNRRLQRQTSQSGLLCGMLGISPVMEEVFERLKHVSKTDYPVLIIGETGTGKEMAARAVHSLSQRAEKTLIIINCGAIPENLLESELFGHEKGAFTGAAGRKIGKFERADQGTIFLDEIGELSLLLQVKILRFLQESTIERLGGTKTIAMNVRIIAATNINLENAVKQGTFREDLFYRLNVVPLRIPDLNERPEDTLLLAHNFLLEETRKLQRGQTSFSQAAIAALTAHDWPGNVRELQNRIRRALGTTINRVITPVDLGLEDMPMEQEEQKLCTLKDARKTAEKNAVRRALAMSGNNISQAAKLLEISRPTLHDLLKKHGM